MTLIGTGIYCRASGSIGEGMYARPFRVYFSHLEDQAHNQGMGETQSENFLLEIFKNIISC